MSFSTSIFSNISYWATLCSSSSSLLPLFCLKFWRRTFSVSSLLMWSRCFSTTFSQVLRPCCVRTSSYLKIRSRFSASASCSQSMLLLESFWLRLKS